MVLTQEDVSAIETVAHYTHDEDQAYLMLYGAAPPTPARPQELAWSSPPAAALLLVPLTAWPVGAGEGVDRTMVFRQRKIQQGRELKRLFYHPGCDLDRPRQKEECLHDADVNMHKFGIARPRQ